MRSNVCTDELVSYIGITVVYNAKHSHIVRAVNKNYNEIVRWATCGSYSSNTLTEHM